MAVVNNKIENIYSLTPLQEGMLFHSLMGTASSEYVVQEIFEAKELNEEMFRKAANLVTLRYDALRTAFAYEKLKKPRQIVLRERSPEYSYVDISNDISDKEKLINKILNEDIKRGFDLVKDTLLRIKVIKIRDDLYRMVFTSHHIIVDGWCTMTIYEKFFTYYEELLGGKTETSIINDIESEKASEPRYGDYIKWLDTIDKEKAMEYWANELSDYDNNCDIKPLKAPLPTDVSNAELRIEIDKDTTNTLRAIAERNETTINTVAETAVGIMLQKYCRSNDVVFGKVVSGRNVPINGIENVVGLFVNTIPLRVKSDQNDTVEELIVKQHKKGTESTNYDFCSLAEVQSLTPQGGDLIKVLYVFENISSTSPEESQEDSTISFVGGREETNYGITLSGFEDDGKLGFKLLYEPHKFIQSEIQLLLERLKKICEEMADKPDAKVCELETVTEAEKQLILNDFNATATEYPRDKTVVELFEEQVKKTPENIALVFEDRKLTYAELNARANSLAHSLRELGVKADDFVAIIADKSIEIIEGIYGIIKAGGAYLPIDPTYPEDRIAFMLEDSAAKVVLKFTDEPLNIPADLTVIDLSDEKVWNGNSSDPETVNKPEDAIYCIYTSGTTGKPKGVVVEHHNVVKLVMNCDYTELNVESVILQTGQLMFDASTFEVWGAALNGGTLHLISKENMLNAATFKKYLIENKVNTLFITTALFNQFIGEDKTIFNSLKHLMFGGEATSERHVEMLRSQNTDVDFRNVYGPTETTTFAAHYIIKEKVDKTPIGKPISNTQMYVLNGNELCGIGVPGELCIAGDGVARGYLNRPELNAEKFVKNPFGEGKMYRSGDLVRWLSDGNIEFLGRIDEQVKIHGFRIELGEIETRIRDIENIKDCVVIVKPDNTGDKAIYAYYTGTEKVEITEIRSKLAENMPEYMVPAYMMQLEELPVTKNGKIDKRALPEIEARAAREYVAPRNEIEAKICEIFSEILSVEQVGVKDSFFELGGHSLRATRLVNRIEAETGTRIALKEVFAHPTVEQLAVLAGGESEEYVPIPKAEEKEYYAMSSAQKRTYLIQQMDTEAVTYNMPANLKLTGEVRPDAMREALQAMTNRHEILRTVFLMVEGEPVQKILDHVEADFEYATSSESDEELMTEFLKPFDLASGRLVRVKLVNKGEYHLMMFDMHHIVGDGMSMNTFATELMALYNGEKLEPLTHQFKDYSEWMQTRDLSGQAEYWKRQFDDEIPVLDMPLDFPRPQEQSYAGRTINCELNEKLSEKIKELVKKTGTTEYMVFLAAAMVTLSKYSRQEDIVIGSPISGRTHRDTEGMLGMFVNTLAMRGKPEKDKTFREFLEEIKNTCLKAYENQEYPFEELVEAVDVQRDMSRNPIFDVMLALQNNENVDVKLGDSETEGTGISGTIAKFDMTFNIAKTKDGFVISFEYCTDLFKAETAERILNHFEKILGEVTADSEQKLCSIEMATESEKQLILNAFNATATEYPRDKTVVELFEEQVKKTPDNTALVFEDEKLTYAELNAKANSLAHRLRELGVKPDDFVAIIADKSIEIIEGIYGIIKAGGAYLPIDPTYPEDRIAFMLEDSAAKVVLKFTDEPLNIPADLTVIDLSDEKVWNGNSSDPETVNKPEDAIYCIYTSGTTGKPKGVVVEHHNVVKLVMNCDYTELNVESVILQTGQLMFDASTFEVWGAALNGGTLHLISKENMLNAATFKKYLIENKVNTLFITTALFNQFIGEDKTIFNSLKHLMFGGEATSERHVEMLRSQNTDVDFRNVYGPTETTTFAAHYIIKEKVDKTPIGKPISNTQMYVLNGNELCGIGVPGELCIAGDGVARGYLNRPELNAEKFVKNPFGEGKMYRSGDLVRWLSDGNIEFLGRIDEQVKIHGFRIELGEIETRIRDIENIKDCVVIVKPDNTGDKAIYAYYTGTEKVEITEIRSKLAENMPEYMVPAYMMQLEELPVTKNGKIDKRALPEIEARAAREYVAPRNEIEAKICEIFSEILSVEQVGVKDSFFELGGHSLRATRLVNRIEAETGTRIALKEVFAHPTVEQLAVLAGGESEEYVPIPKAEEKEYYAMSSAQKRTYLIQLMQPKAITYNMPGNFKLLGKVYPEKLKDALQAMTDRHEILRTVFLMVDGEPVQKILDHVEADFEYVTSNESDEKLMTEFLKPFDLASGRLVRVKLVNKGEYHLMMFDMHHIVGDGMSMNTFATELMSLYNGEKLEPLTHQFKDYSEWMQTRDLSGQAEYWKSQFDDEIPVLDMPTDFPRPQEQSYAGRTISCELNEKLSEAIKELVKKTGATEYMVFLSVAMITLSKYSRQEDIVIGSPISGRTHRDTEGMLGMFVNTLAMRGKPEKNKTFREFLEEIKNTCLKAYENQEYPFEELVEAVDVQRDMSRNPIFDVMLALQNNENVDFRLGSSGTEVSESDGTIAKFDMTFNIAKTKDGFVVSFEYCTDLFKSETAERILKHFEETLGAVTADSEQKLCNIEMATESEKQLILNDFNATETDYSRDKTVVELFEEQVKKTPDNIALVFEDKKLTYAELNARANSLAHKLREFGVKPDDFVAIIADRSIEMIAGIYGIIKAGGAYVPIDPTYPEDRIRYMLEDCAAKSAVVYTTEKMNIPENISIIDLSDSNVWNYSEEDPEHVNKPSDLAYCIYTSGTTGKPKGVMLEHHGVVAMQDYLENLYEVTENDNVLQFANYIFDASVWEMTLALYCGATLVLVLHDTITDTAAFEKYVSENNVTLTLLPPQYFRQTDIDTFRVMTTGGSASDSDVVKHVKENCRYINAYGPTENTVLATHWEYEHGTEVPANIPIGKPMSNSKIYMLNGDTLCGIGVPGELCISGDGLARGYLNRPELTAEKFVKNPFGEGRMYRTGDLARWLPDGNIEYLGRIDEQVKIRGFRIELGEIESRIREIEKIKDCAVIARADSTGEKAIYAYYTSDNEVSVSEVRDRLRENLPEYMMPAYLMQLEELPVTKNGKIDKRALPEIEAIVTREYVAPRNEAEAAVCQAFSEILNVERVGVKDSFFELGGDSIKAIRIISKLRNVGYSTIIKDIMTGRTAEKIAIALKIVTDNQKYEQGEVSGIVESTPIIKSFGEWNLSKPGHFNQSMMFPVDGIANDVIRRAIEELVKHHDVLRAVYRGNILEILPIAESKLCDFYEFDYRNEADKHRAVEEKCTEIQSSIDLENGPIVKIAVFELGDTKQMMFCIHHLAVDGVSWRILQEDFETAVSQLKEGKEVKLPEKTASFIEWSKKLKEYGERLGSKEKEYWKKSNAKMAEGRVTGKYAEKCGFAVVEFSQEITERLLTKSSNAFGAKIDEVLLAGLARAVGRVTGQKNVAIKLEGHGREEIHEPISIDRTVGWFTNVYAVSLECSEDNERSIINAKDTVRSVPNMGMGFGYVEHETMPDICFNYLGDFSENRTSFINEYTTGEDVSSENKYEDNNLINGGVAENKLRFDVFSRFGQRFADQLKNTFKSSVEQLTEYFFEHERKTSIDYLTIENSKAVICSESIFAYYDIKNNNSEYKCENIAADYIESIIHNEVIDTYAPLKSQKMFLQSTNNICETKLSITNKSLEEVITALNEMVRTQEVFRTTYNKSIDMMKVYAYSEAKFPIINNIDYDKWRASLYITYKQMCLYEESLLSRVFVESINAQNLNVYFLFDHAVSDYMSCSIIPELFLNILNGNKNKYLPSSNFSNVIKHKSTIVNDNGIYNFKKIHKSVSNYYNFLSSDMHKYAIVTVNKICNKEEIEKINTDVFYWFMDKISDMMPDELFEQDKMAIPFVFIHNDRTSSDYQTLGMFLSNIAGVYENHKSIEQLMRNISMYQSKDMNIPDILDRLEDDVLLEHLKMVPVINIQNMRSDLSVEKDMVSIRKIEKYSSLFFLLMNNNQIRVELPIVYSDEDSLKKKISSLFSIDEKLIQDMRDV